jgi:predicted phosphodiesterase
MRVLLVHLSDVHVTGPADPILARRDAIIDAVKNLDYSIDLCVIVVTGDIAYSGKEIEYYYAWELIKGVADGLRKSIPRPASQNQIVVHCVAVPGNHDCDFGGSGNARTLVLDGVLKEPSQCQDASILKICTEVQNSFFEFLESFASEGRRDSVAGVAGYGARLCYEYNFAVGGHAIRFLCFNTAWVSRLREVQGQLVFPAEAVPGVGGNHSLTVALLHHPYNWLEAGTCRPFRKRIEQVADLVLTGHEHEATRRAQEGGGGERNTYVEGGALQDSEDRSASAFNALVLDLEKGKVALLPPAYTCFSWSSFSNAMTC